MSSEESPNEIFYHAANGDVERFCKKYPEAVKQRDARGRTALVHAALMDNIKNAQFLIRKGLSIWDVDNNNATVLHYAVHSAAIKLMKLILQSGNTPQGIPFLAQDKEGVTPLHIAAKKSSDKTLRIMVETIHSPSEDIFSRASDNKSRSPLHYAAASCSYECCRFIIDSDVLGLPVDQKDKFQMTPLMCAVGVRLPQAVEVVRLLAYRKPVSVSARNCDGQTALHLAIAADNQPVIDVLLQEIKCQVEVFDNEFRTPLHYAADFGYVDAVRKLLAAGARNNTRDRYGITPAHYAAQNSAQAMALLLQQSDKSTTRFKDLKDNEQRTCFMWAVVAGNVEAIEFLLGNCAPDRQEQDCRGYTALHLAALVGNERICKLLHKQGWNLNEQDKNVMTALHLAAGRGHTDVVRYLVTAGASTLETDSVRRSPIFSACYGGQAHTLYVMIKELGFEWRTVDSVDMKGQKMPVTDSLGRTPLHAAAFAGFSHCITQMLHIEKEDDCLYAPLIGHADQNGETALHVACYRGRLDCVLVLLKGGAGLNPLDKEGRTPLLCAKAAGHKAIVEHLQSLGALMPEALLEVAATVLQKAYRRHVQLRKKRIEDIRL